MPKKGSRKVQFEIKGFTVDQTEDGGWLMRVVQEGLLDGLSDVAMAIEEAKAQAPNVVVSSATVKEIATETVEPMQIVPSTVAQDSRPQAPDAGTVPQDMSDPTLGSSGNLLPFAPEGQPDTKAVIKRVRETKGGEK